MIIRKGSINYALVSLLFLSLFSSPSFSLVVVVLKRIESRRLFSHVSPRYFFRLSGKKTFRIQFLRAGKIIDNGRRRFEAWNFPVSSSEYSLFCRRRGGNVGNAIRGGSDPFFFFFGYKFPLAPRKKVSRVGVNDNFRLKLSRRQQWLHFLSTNSNIFFPSHCNAFASYSRFPLMKNNFYIRLLLLCKSREKYLFLILDNFIYTFV